MYCRNCETANPENTAFCKNCGERLKAVQRPASSRAGENRTIEKPQIQCVQRPATNIRSKRRKRRIFTPVIVVVLLLLAAFMLFGGRSYKATIDQFVDAQFEVDSAAIFNLISDNILITRWKMKAMIETTSATCFMRGMRRFRISLTQSSDILGKLVCLI